MGLTTVQAEGFARALDEATLIGMEIEIRRRIVGLTMVLPLSPTVRGSSEGDTATLLVLERVARIVAHREPEPNQATPDQLMLAELPAFLRTLAQVPGDHAMSGLNVVDCDLSRSPIRDWWDRRSLDITLSDSALASHTLYVWHDAEEQRLDVVIWFEDLRLCDRQGIPISLEALIAASDEWWGTWSAGELREAGKSWLIEPIPLASCSDQGTA